MPEVKCSVANCEYWFTGNTCSADAIMIEIDRHANADFKTEFAGESFKTERQDTAVNSSATCCHTFKQRK
ncbi:DUF1540 domain-containing protein [Ferviditalea candida]|uniref:DUF1540 domain-containing protein n=1 Tax=Ferviditalea candida TaxID=3108399 RepID=A0ABU5ZDU0_9BACL|nr:DUF1540 domain-containing protein [Paenibacillaceae bacterium T2]